MGPSLPLMAQWDSSNFQAAKVFKCIYLAGQLLRWSQTIEKLLGWVLISFTKASQ